MEVNRNYEEALERARNFYEFCKKSDRKKAAEIILNIFPELEEDEDKDEKIRKAILEHIQLCTESIPDRDKFIAWLEKQGTPAKLSEEEQNRFAKSVLTNCATSFIDYLDAHRYEGKMCVSNGECEDIENAFQNAMWDRLHRYYCKYIEKQGDKDKLITELGEYKVKYTQEVLEKQLNSMGNKDDERLRKTAIDFLKDFAEQGYENAVECIDWLKKQGEQKPMTEPIFKIGDTLRRKGKDYTFIVDRIQGGYYHCDHNNGAFFPIEKQYEWELVDKVEPKFRVGDWGIDKEDGTIFQIVKVLNNTYTYRTNEGDEYSCTHYSLENDARLWTLQDAKDGDVLCCKSGWTCIFKSLVNDETFSSYCFMDKTKRFYEIGSERHTFKDELVKSYNGEIYPATKEQCELFFQKMREDGYEWNVNEKELKKIEQKPIDKPKFKVEKGEWYVCTQTFVLRGENVVIKGQVYKSNQNGAIEGENKRLFIDTHDGKASEYFIPWTIQYANDGDVLYSIDSKQPFIYKERKPFEQATAYCGINKYGKFFVWKTKDCIITTDKYVPATKEQRDLLFQKMKEAGYKWDAGTKELKKIEQKPWSEDDGNEDSGILQRFSFYSYEDEPDILYLAGLYVNEEHRKKGIGTRILKVADDVAKCLNCHTIRLKTKKDSNAERLYRANGYNSLANEESDEIWLEKQSEQ